MLKLMAEGRSNAGIKECLFVEVKTVEKHIASIFSKLGLRTDATEHHRRVLRRADLPARPGPGSQYLRRMVPLG